MTAKALSRFLGQIRWHSRMIRHLADFATSLHAAVQWVPFQWAETEEKAYQALKVMLSQALVVQPPNWTKSFHVFVDASDIAMVSKASLTSKITRWTLLLQEFEFDIFH